MAVRFVAGDIITGKLLNQVPFATFQHRHVLGGPGSWTSTVPHDEPKISGTNRKLLTPNRSTIWVLDGTNGPPLFGGIVRQPSAIPADTGIEDLTVGGDGFWGYYRGNGSDIGRMWTDADQDISGSALLGGSYHVIQQILAAANSHGNIGVQFAYDGVGPPVPTQHMAQADSSNVGTVIEQFCTDYLIAFDTDFDWDTTVMPWLPVAIQRFSYPRRGRDTAIVLEHGRNVDLVNWAADGFTQANTVLGIGAGSLRASSTSSEPGFPRIDATFVDKTITDQTRLDDATQASLDGRLGVTRTARVEVRPTALSTLTPTSLKTGDTVELVINDGYIVESGERWRVDAVEANYDTEGELNPLAFELSTNATTARAVTPPPYVLLAELAQFSRGIAALQRLT